jgi:hypothetical protein
VALGQHDRDNDNEPGKQKIVIEEVFIHPNYEKPGIKLESISGIKLESISGIKIESISGICKA